METWEKEKTWECFSSGERGVFFAGHLFSRFVTKQANSLYIPSKSHKLISFMILFGIIKALITLIQALDERFFFTDSLNPFH